MWSVYVLLCSDGSLYTGITRDINKRFNIHQVGKGGRYTRSHKPVKLLHKERFQTQSRALKREFEIKSWTRTKKIQNLQLSI